MDTAQAQAERPRAMLPLFIGLILIPVLLASSSTLFNDGDVSWHIATGQWILDHRSIPHTDPFSFTWAGRPWVPFEWLAEVLFAGCYRLAGYSGIAALAACALMALHAIVYLNSSRFVRPLAAIFLLLAMDAVLVPMMLARPHLLAWPLVAFWTWLMLRARDRNEPPPLIAAAVMIVWANLHASFALGLLITAAFGIEAVLSSPDRVRALRGWLIFGGACFIAVFINANGIDGPLHPFLVAKLSHLPLIDEWKPSNPRVTPFFFVVLAGAALMIWRLRPRLHPVRWALLAALLALAFYQTRHQPILAIVAAILLPAGLARRDAANPTSPATMWVIAGVMAAFVTVRAILPVTLPANDANPWKLIVAIPPDLRAQPVLNGYSMGGPLILSGIRPYIDGRSDMYGDEVVTQYKRITDGDAPAFDQAVQRWNIRWAILPLRYKKLIALLDRSPGWRVIRRDEVGAIYVRD